MKDKFDMATFKRKCKRKSEEVRLCADSLPQGDRSGTPVNSLAALVAMAAPVIGEDHIEESTSVDLKRKSEEVRLCADSLPQGDRSGTPVNSLAALVAMAAPVIGEDHIEESTSVDLIKNGEPPAPCYIGQNNLFEIGCKVLAKSIGNHNLFGADCFVGPEVEITDCCIIGPGCKVVSARRLPEATVIVGRYQPVAADQASLKLDDFTRQGSEIDLLRSIYPAEFNAFFDGHQYHAVFDMDISLNEKLTLTSIENSNLPDSVSCFLPPIHLEVFFPQDYPSQSCPDFNISSCWLAKYRLDNLAAEMLRLWEKDRCDILLSWCFLLQDPLIFLGIEDQGYYDLNEKYLMNVGNPHTGIDVDNKKCSEVGNSLIGNIAVSFNEQNEKDEVKSYHEVAVTKLHFYLTEYDFMKSLHECIICFSTCRANTCERLLCGHVSCLECLQNMLEFKIVHQKWREFECPECSFKIEKDFVQSHVSEEMFERYTNMMYIKTLESNPNCVYCPRLRCGYAFLHNEDDYGLAICPDCDHPFCIYCKRTYHGVEKCRISGEEKIVNDYQMGDKETKLRLEKQYGRKNVLTMVHNAEFEIWKKKECKPCPSCHVSIEKNQGCNKMICQKCTVRFCWLCLLRLPRSNPYQHYSNINSPCYYGLYNGVPDDEIPAEFLEEDQAQGELWEGEEPLEGQPQDYELQGEVEEGLLHEGEPKADEVPQYLISDELYALQLIEEDLNAHDAKWDATADD